MTKNKLMYFGGLPTKIDVDKMVERFGVPAPGDKIAYEEIESLLMIQRGNGRWHSVTTAWRKKMWTEHNIVFEAIQNEGFLCLKSSERVGYSSRKIKSGRRLIMRGVKIIQATPDDELDDDMKRLHRHIMSIPGKLKAAEITESKTLPY